MQAGSNATQSRAGREAARLAEARQRERDALDAAIAECAQRQQAALAAVAAAAKEASLGCSSSSGSSVRAEVEVSAAPRVLLAAAAAVAAADVDTGDNAGAMAHLNADAGAGADAGTGAHELAAAQLAASRMRSPPASLAAMLGFLDRRRRGGGADRAHAAVITEASPSPGQPAAAAAVSAAELTPTLRERMRGVDARIDEVRRRAAAAAAAAASDLRATLADRALAADLRRGRAARARARDDAERLQLHWATDAPPRWAAAAERDKRAAQSAGLSPAVAAALPARTRRALQAMSLAAFE